MYTQYRGFLNGVAGTWYEEKCQGGPGMYPYVKKHFVADVAAQAVDTRHKPAT